ncbi:flagellar M-ring protein FliF [Sphingomonas vulcanisoli]|uniref:Flagellar M-ring protein n=1 Tax=Sphingomonas vulcanisoli TaxID=1658060 RepID=A0ABX0TVW6_9SPHN|nr:flagellar basal-body MS-ring/collar protein FliF [Sphingomonas vulcanisoli]NIJ09576.1 flagellar M-ring protein FliF [Sphingomonas vulcanisoli]
MSENALTTAPAAAPRVTIPQTGPALERVKTFARQPAVAKSLPLLGILVAVAIAASAWMTFATGPQRDLFTGLGDADKAAMADQLKSGGIKYSLDRDTGAISVSESDYYRAKMLLAQAGLPKSAPDGDSLISSLPMGASRAVEGERLRQSREMDLARTIEAIDAVESAKVHLAAEQQSVFVRDNAPASASVMLRIRQGRALSDGQTQAIVNLIASSVPGLSPDNVSVVDQSGHLLSRNGGGDGAADRQVELQQKIEQRYQDQIAKLLTPLVGADGFTSEVHADLDFAETQATRESFPKDTAVLAREQGGWANDAANGQAPAGGIPGAIANQPPTSPQVSATPTPGLAPGATPQAGTTAAAAASKTSENYDRSYQLGHEVSVTKNPVGSIKRLSVAIALKEGAKPRGVAEMAQLEQLLKGGVGFDQARGDQFALSSRSFVDMTTAADKAKWYEASWVGIAARNVTGLIIALLLFFGVVKPLSKKLLASSPADAGAAGGDRPAIGNEIAAALANQAVADPSRPVTLDMIEAAPGYSDRAALIRNFVRQDPARAALVVRDLIRADMPGAVDG